MWWFTPILPEINQWLDEWEKIRKQSFGEQGEIKGDEAFKRFTDAGGFTHLISLMEMLRVVGHYIPLNAEKNTGMELDYHIDTYTT